jgi:hypothetical protein
MLYRATFRYPTTKAGGVTGYGFYLEAADLEAATAKAAARCSAAATLESVTLAPQACQR